jgi:hypothetical protein
MENLQPEDGRSDSSAGWRLFGSGQRFPKSEVVFFTQIILIYIVCVCSLVNLSLGNKNQLWTILLTSCLGYLMPNPSLKRKQQHYAPITATLSHAA